jgi:hypothetical protein
MVDRIGQRSSEIIAAQRAEEAAKQEAQQRAADRDRRLKAAAARLPDLMEMGRLRQIFLGKDERLVVKQERARRARVEWLEPRCAEVDNLCALFQNWATRAGLPTNERLGWLVHSQNSVEFTDKLINPDSQYSQYESYTVTTNYYIPTQRQHQDDYSNGTVRNLQVTTMASEGGHGYSPMPGDFQLHPFYQSAYEETMYSLEGSMAAIVASRPDTPWTGQIEDLNPAPPVAEDPWQSPRWPQHPNFDRGN